MSFQCEGKTKNGARCLRQTKSLGKRCPQHPVTTHSSTRAPTHVQTESDSSSDDDLEERVVELEKTIAQLKQQFSLLSMEGRRPATRECPLCTEQKPTNSFVECCETDNCTTVCEQCYDSTLIKIPTTDNSYFLRCPFCRDETIITR